jgi:hypothetical protein
MEEIVKVQSGALNFLEIAEITSKPVAISSRAKKCGIVTSYALSYLFLPLSIIKNLIF